MTSTHRMSVRPSSTWWRRAAPAPLARAARMVDRWGLVAGLTGILGNVLLAVLFITPTDGPYAWTGPANDTVLIVSTLAMIPVAAGLLGVCGNRPGLGAITSLAILAMVMIAAVSLLFVLGRAPFTADVDSYYAGLFLISGWFFAASRAGRASGRLPRKVANCGLALGAAGLAGAALLAASELTPAHSLMQDVTFGAGALVFGPVVAAYPVWLIVLSCRLPGHLAHHADFLGRRPDNGRAGARAASATGGQHHVAGGTCGLGSRNAAQLMRGPGS